MLTSKKVDGFIWYYDEEKENKGINMEQEFKNGDRILWHFKDVYLYGTYCGKANEYSYEKGDYSIIEIIDSKGEVKCIYVLTNSIKNELRDKFKYDEINVGDEVLLDGYDCEGVVSGRVIGRSFEYGGYVIEYNATSRHNEKQIKFGYAGIKRLRKKPETKKRLMTAKELAGKWVKYYEKHPDHYLITQFENNKILMGSTWMRTEKEMLYTSTPSDDSSWRSVEVEV
jgi:hypothetical protein